MHLVRVPSVRRAAIGLNTTRATLRRAAMFLVAFLQRHGHALASDC